MEKSSSLKSRVSTTISHNDYRESTYDRESRELKEKFLEKLEDAICGGLWS